MTKFNIPARARAIIYILTALSTPVIAYLFAKGYIGELEVTLFGGLITAVTAMASLNTPTSTK